MDTLVHLTAQPSQSPGRLGEFLEGGLAGGFGGGGHGKGRAPTRRTYARRRGQVGRICPCHLDRFLHHAEIIPITGESYRLKNHACNHPKDELPVTNP